MESINKSKDEVAERLEKGKDPVLEGHEEDDDEDVPKLSASTLAALQEFYSEQKALRELIEGSCNKEISGSSEVSHDNNAGKVKEEDSGDAGNEISDRLFKIDLGKSFPEDWQLSQFWYDEDTSNLLAAEVLKLAGSRKVACISCPSIFRACENSPNVILFEFDRRFKAFGPSFQFYDYNEPETIPDEYLGAFSVVVADPPFLSEECLKKVAVTVKKIVEKNGKIILCTGAIMEQLADSILGLKRSSFVPHHKNNLGNEFACFTNYSMTSEPTT